MIGLEQLDEFKATTLIDCRIVYDNESSIFRLVLDSFGGYGNMQ